MAIDVKTKVIKRNGEEVSFDISKIENAITKANAEVDRIHQMNEYQIVAIAEKIAEMVKESTHAECGGYPGSGGDQHHGDARL